MGTCLCNELIVHIMSDTVQHLQMFVSDIMCTICDDVLNMNMVSVIIYTMCDDVVNMNIVSDMAEFGTQAYVHIYYIRYNIYGHVPCHELEVELAQEFKALQKHAPAAIYLLHLHSCKQGNR